MPESSGGTEFDWEALGEEWQRAFRWVEATIGGRLVAAHRQARWRPAWFLEVEREGERLPLYWRGDRGLEGRGPRRYRNCDSRRQRAQPRRGGAKPGY